MGLSEGEATGNTVRQKHTSRKRSNNGRRLATGPAQALDLLILILDHPITTQETKDRLPPLQTELVAELPPDQVTTAQHRGQARQLEVALKEWVGKARPRP